MHNKSFIVDNQMGIVGGRNIAAEYFDLEHDKEFVDFDMLAVGSVVADVSKTFDQFWNHEYSVPVQAFADRHSEKQLEETRRKISEALEMAGESNYGRAIDSRFVRDVHDGLIALYPAKAMVVTDDPEKLQHKTSGDYKRCSSAQ
jgi:putative cardiolipin synthase